MATDLTDYVPALLRQVNPPGADAYASVTQDTLLGFLVDAFWEARLDGFLTGYSADEDGFVTDAAGAEADLPREQIALVILYAGIKVVRNRILNTQTLFRAKAGPVEIETQNSATVLAELLKQLSVTKKTLLEASAWEGSGVGAYDLTIERLTARMLPGGR